MACQAFALGVADDDLVAALLLHDVVEDNSDKISFSDLPVNDTTMEVIRLVTKEKGYDSEKYYEDISKNPAASLVKCIDRCNNLSTMAQGFTKERIIKYIKETDNKFASKISQKNMTNSDKNVQVTCVAAGNPDGEYFSTGWTGKFKGSHKEECWTGKMLTTTYFDGTTGAVLAGEGKIAAYATYSETHALWTDDEYWAFVDSTGGNYFYLLTRTGTIL